MSKTANRTVHEVPLTSAYKMHYKFPKRFDLPESPIRVKDLVKVCQLLDGPVGGERFWVEVIRRVNGVDPVYVGRVENKTFYSAPYGAHIYFKRENAFDIWPHNKKTSDMGVSANM
jgi:hypothetical protein